MDRTAVIQKAQRQVRLERFRLTLLLGREPSPQELHDSVREQAIEWCESWFSEQEKALSEDARHALALSWLQEVGVLPILEASFDETPR